MFIPSMEKFRSYLEKLYLEQPEDLKKKITDFVCTPINIKKEILNIKEEMERKEVDFIKSIFILEILSKSVKTHKEFREYIDVVIGILDNFSDIKYSIFSLRLLKSVINTRFYVPLSFYLFRIVRNSMNVKNLVTTNVDIDYDFIKLKDETIKSEEFHLFICKEFETLLLTHLSAYSNNIGFPELASIVINELMKLKIGIYAEFFDRIMAKIEKHKKYVIEERSKYNMIDSQKVVEFEKKVNKMKI